MQTMTIIVPCYNEEEALPYFYEEISKIRQQLTEISLKLLFINDGSTDNTLATLKKLASSDNSVYYISFSRNFGKEAAIYAGLKNPTISSVMFPFLPPFSVWFLCYRNLKLCLMYAVLCSDLEFCFISGTHDRECLPIIGLCLSPQITFFIIRTGISECL